MSRRYFGTDGVRGRVGQAPITPDFVMRLGYAAGRVLVATEHLPAGEHPAVLIGKDTRVSGYMLEAALEAGFAAAGVDTVLAKVVPTPAVAYLTRALRLQAGVVISASHNPFEDNGIKFFSARGTKLPDEVELQIESLLDEPMGCMESSRLGKARRIEDAPGRYIEFCKSTFPTELDLRGLKIALDCAHGAAYSIAPKVFHELGAEVVCVGCSPNGMNINDGVGATAPSSLSEAVRTHGADIGIALDGDADRVVIVDENGTVVDGDQIMALIALRMMERGSLRGGGVVATVMSNLGLERHLAAHGLSLERTAVGDRHVLERMREGGFNVGGEQSGHMILLDHGTTGDGTVAALRVLASLVRSGKRASELLHQFDPVPQLLKTVRYSAGKPLENSAVKAVIADAEAELAGKGRLVIRASGTEPLIRVMAEGDDAAQVERVVDTICDAVKAAA